MWPAGYDSRYADPAHQQALGQGGQRGLGAVRRRSGALPGRHVLATGYPERQAQQHDACGGRHQATHQPGLQCQPGVR